MINANFIHFSRDGKHSLLNVSEIAFVYQEDFDLRVEQDRRLYHRIEWEQGMLYTIQFMLTSQREMEMIYTTAADRDEMYQRIITAISPGTIIESTYAKPAFKPKLPDDDPAKTFTRDEVFLTKEEFDLAVQARVQLAVQMEKAIWEAAIPAPKPPRKPYTRNPRKPRE